MEKYRRIYQDSLKNKRLYIVIVAILDIVLLFVCLCVGSSNIGIKGTFEGLFNLNETNSLIIWNIRMPRIIAAVVAGGGLSISGLVMQNVLKNPMASPSTLGVSNAATFGANFGIIVLGLGVINSSNSNDIIINNPYLVSLFALICALVSVGLILLLSRIRKFDNEAIVLSGLAIGAIFSAGTTIIQYFSDENQLSSAVYWSFGNLSRANYLEDLILGVVTIGSLIYFLINSLNYNALSSGIDNAKTMGVKTLSLTIISLLLASLITAISVSFLGIIGFIGLISPHITKRFIKDDFRFSIIGTFLTGIGILLLSDTLSRCLISGISLPVGAITSLFGGPMFIYLLIRKKKIS